jgi:fucose permease
VDEWEFLLLELGCLYKVWLVEQLKVEQVGLMIGLVIGLVIGVFFACLLADSVLKIDWSVFCLLMFISDNGEEFLTFYSQLDIDWSWLWEL